MLPDELETVNARQAELERITADMQAEEIERAKRWQQARSERLGVTPGATIERVNEALSEVCLVYKEGPSTSVPHPDEVDPVRDGVESGDESKKDDGKAPYGLIPNEALEALAHLYGLGARKYRPRGWEDGMAWQRIFDAMERHGRKWWGGETYDQVDGQHHLIAVAWCAFALYCYEMRGIGEDNRP